MVDMKMFYEQSSYFVRGAAEEVFFFSRGVYLRPRANRDYFFFNINLLSNMMQHTIGEKISVP